jgi:hypothetical protein
MNYSQNNLQNVLLDDIHMDLEKILINHGKKIIEQYDINSNNISILVKKIIENCNTFPELENNEKFNIIVNALIKLINDNIKDDIQGSKFLKDVSINNKKIMNDIIREIVIKFINISKKKSNHNIINNKKINKNKIKTITNIEIINNELLNIINSNQEYKKLIDSFNDDLSNIVTLLYNVMNEIELYISLKGEEKKILILKLLKTIIVTNNNNNNYDDNNDNNQTFDSLLFIINNIIPNLIDSLVLTSKYKLNLEIINDVNFLLNCFKCI